MQRLPAFAADSREAVEVSYLSEDDAIELERGAGRTMQVKASVLVRVEQS